jgi:hypothetical protein
MTKGDASKEAARLAVYRKEQLPDNILAEMQLYQELFDKGYQYAQLEIKESLRKDKLLMGPDSSVARPSL